MKSLLLSVSLLLGNIPAGFAQGPTPSPVVEPMTEEEFLVVAAAVSKLHLNSSTKWFYISNLTTSFQANPPKATGLSIAGGNGMKTKSQSPRDVFLELTTNLPGITPELFNALCVNNQVSTEIKKTLPLPTKQFIWGPTSNSEMPKEWGTPDFAIYFSRVGFSADRKIALVYVASTSWVNIANSGGEYLVLALKNTKWVVTGHYKKWSLVNGA